MRVLSVLFSYELRCTPLARDLDERAGRDDATLGALLAESSGTISRSELGLDVWREEGTRGRAF